MPKTLIPPFSADGSSAPEEKKLHPNLLQEILRRLVTGAVGFAGGYGGNPLLGYQLGRDIQNRREQGVSNAILGRILGQSLQFGQTPETATDIGGVERQFAGGMSPSQIVGQIQGGNLPQTQNPVYADLIQRILQGSQQFAQMGGDPNQLVNVLTKTGVMESPQEKVATIREKGYAERDKIKNQTITAYQKAMLDLGNRRQTTADRLAKTREKEVALRVSGKPVSPELAFRMVSDYESDYQDYLKEIKNENMLGRATQELFVPQQPKDFNTWMTTEKGVDPSTLDEYRQIYQAKKPQKNNTETKLKPFTPAQIAETKKRGGKKYLAQPGIRKWFIDKGYNPDSYKE